MKRPPSTPPELPGYTFVKVLGGGGFSDVFLYEQHLPKRRVAVKVLLVDELTSAHRAAFVAEANLMAQLSAHPYIVTIHHADVSADDRPFFVMEYCSGPSLSERYKRERFSVSDALRTGVRLSSAVATAHAAGILHRDIKPANVLSNDYGWPALTDFGISSTVESDALPVHTTTAGAIADTGSGSQAVGMSVPWSPPEMFDDDPEPDVRSDVFSLAATIWTILAGQTPFEVRGRSNGTLDLIGRIERGAITPLQRDDVPRSLIAVLQKGMTTRREERFATALDFGRALQRIELELGYARTELEVPNLNLEAPERGPDGGEDETRVRSVATIDAQPVAGPAGAGLDETRVRGAATVVAQPPAAASGRPTANPAAPAPEETVVRRREPAPPSDSPPAPAPGPAAEPVPASPRRRVVGIVVGVLGAIIVVAVVIGVLQFASPPPGDPDETPGPVVTGPVVGAVIPAPRLAGDPVRDGSTVSFPVTNPDPEADDRLVWRIGNRTDDEPLRPVEGETVLVTDYQDGQTVCIEVSVLRAGKLSSPLQTCYPS